MIDRSAVARGAAVALAILVPPIAIVRAALGGDEDSPVWTIIPIAFLIAFVVGGSIAARRAMNAPYANGATAGATAFGVALAFGIVRTIVTGDSLSAAALVTALLFWQIAASLGVVGAFVAVRRAKIAAATEAREP